MIKPDSEIAALKAARGGRNVCICCDSPLPRTAHKRRVKCDDPDCRRVYNRIYSIDRVRTWRPKRRSPLLDVSEPFVELLAIGGPRVALALQLLEEMTGVSRAA